MALFHSFQTTCDRLYNVLLFPDGGWLVDTNVEEQEQDPAGTSGQDSGEGQPETAEPNRSHHLSVLRSIYIPQVGAQNSFISCCILNHCCSGFLLCEWLSHTTVLLFE